MQNRKNQGFTLMEMLIVVAIIAILIAIAIPTFTSQLERSREAADGANIRAAYAEIMLSAIDDNTQDFSTSVTLRQGQNDWQNKEIKSAMKQLFSNGDAFVPDANGKAVVKWVHTDPAHAEIAKG